VGVEAFTWSQALSYDSKGDDLTAEYEAFNNEHWLRGRYDEYLMGNYGSLRPDTLPDTLEDGSARPGYPFREIIEVLPDTRVQQYYEMTGKYDQFAWGWDDARLDGTTLADYNAGSPPPRITGPSLTPLSANRDKYETMRDDANKKFDDARKMIMVSVVNRLVSALEAYFVTKNQADDVPDEEFARKDTNLLKQLKFSAKLKSYHSKRDTPYVKVTYTF
jgi:hypothetical protein